MRSSGNPPATLDRAAQRTVAITITASVMVTIAVLGSIAIYVTGAR